MLGTINGQYVNRFAVNSNAVSGLSFADLDVIQSSSIVSSAGVSAVDATTDLSQAAHSLSGSGVTALLGASTFAQALQTVSGDGLAAIGSSLLAANDSQGFGGASTGAIVALLNALSAGDTLESTAEAGPIKAVLEFIQESQLLSASASVLSSGIASTAFDDHSMTGAGSNAVASMAQLQDADDTLASLVRMLLAHRYGSGIDRHGPGSRLAPHVTGSSLTVH